MIIVILPPLGKNKIIFIWLPKIRIVTYTVKNLQYICSKQIERFDTEGR